MGHVNAPMVFGVLGAIEMGLDALGIPHGRGGLQAPWNTLDARCALALLQVSVKPTHQDACSMSALQLARDCARTCCMPSAPYARTTSVSTEDGMPESTRWP